MSTISKVGNVVGKVGNVFGKVGNVALSTVETGLNVTTNAVEFTGDIANKALDTTKSVTDNALNITKNAAKTTDEISKNAFAITSNAAKTAENLSTIAVIASETSAQPIGEAIGYISEATRDATRSLKTVAAMANNVLSSTNRILERADNAIKESNANRIAISEKTRDSIIETEKTITDNNNKLRQSQSDNNLQQKIAEDNLRLKRKIAEEESKTKIKLAEEESKLKKTLEEIDRKLKNEEIESNKLKKDFETAQAIFDSDASISRENIYIAVKNYGYKDKDLKNKGWNKSGIFSFYKNHGTSYRIVKLQKGDVTYNVNFNLDEEKGKIGYYIEVRDERYYLDTKNLFGNVLSGDLIKTDNSKPLDTPESKYTVIVQKIRFKIPNRGGKKTNKKRVKKNKRTRARRNRSSYK